MKIFAKPKPRWDVELPNAFVYVGPHFVCLHDDGSVDIYCDGDVRLTKDERREIDRLSAQFSHERHLA